eukprot:3370879-Prymnesium_polylepis.1
MLTRSATSTRACSNCSSINNTQPAFCLPPQGHKPGSTGYRYECKEHSSSGSIGTQRQLATHLQRLPQETELFIVVGQKAGCTAECCRPRSAQRVSAAKEQKCVKHWAAHSPDCQHHQGDVSSLVVRAALAIEIEIAEEVPALHTGHVNVEISVVVFDRNAV